MYWGLYFLNLGLVFTIKCSITNSISFVFHAGHEEYKYMFSIVWHVDLISQRFGLPMYWDLYFLKLGLVFTLKCYITIPISFIFHVANEECKYMSLVLLHVDLVYRYNVVHNICSYNHRHFKIWTIYICTELYRLSHFIFYISCRMKMHVRGLVYERLRLILD